MTTQLVRTLEPVLRHGRASWDRALIPDDEYDARLFNVKEMCQQLELDALLIASDPREPGAISYLNGYMPTTNSALLLIGPGDRRLLVAGLGGGRDHPHMRAVSAARDIVFFPDQGRGIAETLDNWGLYPGRIGLVGVDRSLPEPEADALENALRVAGWKLEPSDNVYAELRRVKRARELRVMRSGYLQLERCACHAGITLAETGDIGRAIIGLEAEARATGFHDFRLLTSYDSEWLEPFTGHRPVSHRGPVAFYLAGEYLGYWSEFADTFLPGDGTCREELREELGKIANRLSPGTVLSDFGMPFEGASKGVELRRIGASLDERVADPAIVEGEVVAAVAWMRNGGSLHIAGEEFLIGKSEARRLAASVRR